MWIPKPIKSTYSGVNRPTFGVSGTTGNAPSRCHKQEQILLYLSFVHLGIPYTILRVSSMFENSGPKASNMYAA